MSEPESFLERWARRKREVARSAAGSAATSAPDARSVTDDDPRRGSEEPRGERESRRIDPPAAGASDPEQGFDLATLPSLDTITAESDIRAFLRPGVPAELSRAALRRAWSADPAIREFVGLAEYDWDFNSGAEIAGFGPLEMTEELRRKITDMVGRNVRSETPEPAVESAAERETADAGENPGDFNASLPSPAVPQPGATADGDEAASPEGLSRNCEDGESASPKYTAVQQLPKDVATGSSEVIPRRHGRALPM